MRIVIVEDNLILLENLKLLLGGERGMTVAGAFDCTEEALPAIGECAPDVLLTDLGLPGQSGVELIRAVRSRFPDMDIMAHTVFEDRDTILNAIKAGANGYILKGSTPRELIEALHNLHEGGAPMSPKIARAVLREFRVEDQEEEFVLSAREKDILTGLENGLSYKEFAERYHISPHTVHTHVKKIYRKLQAKDRAEAILKARKKGIL